MYSLVINSQSHTHNSPSKLSQQQRGGLHGQEASSLTNLKERPQVCVLCHGLLKTCVSLAVIGTVAGVLGEVLYVTNKVIKLYIYIYTNTGCTPLIVQSFVTRLDIQTA